MNILIGSYYTGGTGADKVKTMLANEWAKCDHTVTILSMDDSHGYYELNGNIKRVVLPHYRGFEIYKDVLALRSFLKQHNFDRIVSFADNFSVKMMIASIGLGIKDEIIISERNDPKAEEKDILNRFFRNWAFSRAKKIVFQTVGAQEYFKKRIRDKSCVIPNPISSNLPNRWEGEREKRIVAVGRLETQKNMIMLIEAFAMLVGDYPDYVLEIYGEGSLRHTIKKEIEFRGIVDNVRLCGFCDDIFSKMLKAKMYVSASNYEGISNSMLEALAMGIPTVVTDCPAGGERMFIDSGVNGLLVRIGDVRGLYLAMKKLIEEPELSDSFSLKSPSIRESLNIASIMKEWTKAIS